MATNTHVSAATRNLMLNAGLAAANGGSIAIYSGAQPANADTALSGNTLLAQLSMSATAFANASAGVATANAITSANPSNAGTATWFRIYKSDGTTAVCDGSVGTSSADCIIGTTNIILGASVSVSSCTYSLPA
jgi:hypothetical protein